MCLGLISIFSLYTYKPASLSHTALVTVSQLCASDQRLLVGHLINKEDERQVVIKMYEAICVERKCVNLGK